MTLFGLFKRSKSPEPRPPRRPESQSPPATPPAVLRQGPAVFAPARVIEPSEAPAAADPVAAVTAAPAAAPDEVRRRLFDAVAAGEEEQLAGLCREHWDLLLEHGPGWLSEEVPEPLRSNPRAAEWYGQGLRQIACFCAERLDRPELLQRLDMGPEREDVVRRNDPDPAAEAATHPGQDAA